MAPRILVLSNIVAPYRIPLFNLIAGRGLGEFRVVFLAERTRDRSWTPNKSKIAFRYDVLPGWQWLFPSRRWTLHVNRGLGALLRDYDPDVAIVGGWDAPAYWATLLRARRLARPKVVLWNGSNLLGRGEWRPLDRVKSFFVRRCHSYIAYNSEASRYLRALGAPPDRICLGRNVGEIDFFSAEANAFRRGTEFGPLRNRYPQHLFMFVGYLVPSKGVDVAIRALARTPNQEPGLFIVGDGRERAALQRLADEVMPGRVWFWGDQPRAELARFYALADYFILPSQEPGSIALSEALSAGLYAVGSTLDGNTCDLIQTGVNGEVADPRDLEAVCAAIGRALEKGAAGGASRETVQATVNHGSLERYADAFERSIQLALATTIAPTLGTG